MSGTLIVKLLMTLILLLLKSQTMYCECSAQADDNICTENFKKAMRFIAPELNWPDINAVCLR
jgi:hypothetical protein